MFVYLVPNDLFALPLDSLYTPADSGAFINLYYD